MKYTGVHENDFTAHGYTDQCVRRRAHGQTHDAGARRGHLTRRPPGMLPGPEENFS
jgi:hypothetical protein